MAPKVLTPSRRTGTSSSRRARDADSVPNLDIEENDVRCSHASAVGPIDREQRFYLEARGVPPTVAERLILLGFFDDLLARIKVPGVRDHLVAAVAARLDRVEVGVDR